MATRTIETTVKQEEAIEYAAVLNRTNKDTLFKSRVDRLLDHMVSNYDEDLGRSILSRATQDDKDRLLGR